MPAQIQEDMSIGTEQENMESLRGRSCFENNG